MRPAWKTRKSARMPSLWPKLFPLRSPAPSFRTDPSPSQFGASDVMPAFICEPIEDRFWRKVSVSGDENCWNWMAYKNEHGYGRFTPSKERGPQLAHRISYELTHGTIPTGSIVRHVCDNPACVNPKHLIIGTMRENTNDMMDRKRHYSFRITSCPRGHEYTPENTYLYGTRRQCKACAIERSARQRKLSRDLGVVR